MMTTALIRLPLKPTAGLSDQSETTRSIDPLVNAFRLSGSRSANDTVETIRLSEYQRGLNQQYLI